MIEVYSKGLIMCSVCAPKEMQEHIEKLEAKIRDMEYDL